MRYEMIGSKPDSFEIIPGKATERYLSGYVYSDGMGNVLEKFLIWIK